MVLKAVEGRPDINHCRGYWVEIAQKGTEGLVEGVDLSSGILIVNYGNAQSPEEYEVPYTSPDILGWFRAINPKEEKLMIEAATRIQSAMRGR
jgi:hypothetical protein